MIERLKKEVLAAVGRTITTPLDYEWLSEKVAKRTSEYLSATTLKRLFGYLDREQVKPRNLTLDVLSRFVGYNDYASFCDKHKDTFTQSNLIGNESITADQLADGQIIELRWRPNRVCAVRHIHNGTFEVIEAENTKLNVGDTFDCHLFITHEPLYLNNLIHNNCKPTAYVAGRKDGITFELISETK